MLKQFFVAILRKKYGAKSVIWYYIVLDINVCTAESLESHSQTVQLQFEPPAKSLKHFTEPVAVMRAKDAERVVQ